MASKKNELKIDEIMDERNRHYLTIIEYKNKSYLTIIDNIVDNQISAFVLDYASAEAVDVKWFIQIVNLWFYNNSEKYPLSFEFTKNGTFDKVSKLVKTFNFNEITRISGKLFYYDVTKKQKVKKKRAIQIPQTIEISFAKKT